MYGSHVVMQLIFCRDGKRECLIIGGAGYAGMSLATAIASSGAHVKLFDVKKPSGQLPAKITFVQVFTLYLQ